MNASASFCSRDSSVTWTALFLMFLKLSSLSYETVEIALEVVSDLANSGVLSGTIFPWRPPGRVVGIPFAFAVLINTSSSSSHDSIIAPRGDSSASLSCVADIGS